MKCRITFSVNVNDAPPLFISVSPLTASTMEDSNSVEEGADVKPAVWPPPAEEEEELSGDVEEAPDTAQSGSSQSSKATATSGEGPRRSHLNFSRSSVS